MLVVPDGFIMTTVPREYNSPIGLLFCHMRDGSLILNHVHINVRSCQFTESLNLKATTPCCIQPHFLNINVKVAISEIRNSGFGVERSDLGVVSKVITYKLAQFGAVDVRKFCQRFEQTGHSVCSSILYIKTFLRAPGNSMNRKPKYITDSKGMVLCTSVLPGGFPLFVSDGSTLFPNIHVRRIVDLSFHPKNNDQFPIKFCVMKKGSSGYIECQETDPDFVYVAFPRDNCPTLTTGEHQLRASKMIPSVLNVIRDKIFLQRLSR
jgi:hypothetical protein